MSVLIITYSNDNESTPLVKEAIEKQGGTVYRFDTDRFPTDDRLVVGFGEGVTNQYLETPEGTVDLDEIESIWYRRVRIGQGIPKDLDPQLRAPSLEESRRTFRGMLACCDAFVMDPLHNIRHCEDKQLQLKIAERIGLDVPNTLITNDADAVRAFSVANGGEIVTKMMTAFAVYKGDEEHVVFTNKLTEEDLEDLEGLDLCPMTFQENLEKELELRVTVVGDQVFAAAIDSQISERAKHDWRRNGQEFVTDWKPYELPQDVKAKLLKLMDHFRLNYGAIDIILTPDGRYVFLEVNPCGEFFWLDLYAEQRISEAIANILLGKSYRRPTDLYNL